MRKMVTPVLLKISKRTFLNTIPLASFAYMLTIFLPLIVYFANLDTVRIHKHVILTGGIGIGTLLFLMIWAISQIKKVETVILTTGSVLTIILFFLIIFFPYHTGELTGFETNSELSHSLQIAKILLLLTLSIIFVIRYRNMLQFFPFILFFISIFISLYIVIFIQSNFDSTSRMNRDSVIRSVEMGNTENIIVIVLDGFTGYKMQEIFNTEPELIKEFNGFVYYPHTISPALNTSAGISSILTGNLDIASSSGKLLERNNNSVKNSFLNDAKKYGYQPVFISNISVNQTDIPYFYENDYLLTIQEKESDYLKTYLGFWTTSLSRILPQILFERVDHSLQKAISTNNKPGTSDLDLYENLGRINEKYVVQAKIVFEYIVQNMKVGDYPRKIFFYHTSLSHSPFILDENGKYSLDSSAESTSKFVAATLVTFLKNLKELGIFDSSLIIITSDHGVMPINDNTMGNIYQNSDPLDPMFNSLLLIKKPFEEGPLIVSNMSTWIGDVSASIIDYLGLNQNNSSDLLSRSLLLPEDLTRELNIPLYFMPDQGSRGSSLSEWLKIDVNGKFSDYGEKAYLNSSMLLSENVEVEVISGIDRGRTEMVKQGLISGTGPVYRSTILINRYPIIKLNDPGIIVISDVSGEMEEYTFSDFQEAVIFMKNIGSKNVIIAAGYHVPSNLINLLFPDQEISSKNNENLYFFSYIYNSKLIDQSYLDISLEDARVSATWK